MLYALIIAGGAGKRLWPESRTGSPKFLLKIKGNESLLKHTAERARQVIPEENILISTNKEYVKLLRKELPGFPDKNIIAEPVSRNTAPAVCLAAAIIQKRDPDGVIFVMPADQIIEEEAALKEVFNLASLAARIKNALITVGIKPDFPATAYGYIKVGKLYKSLLTDARYDIYDVEKFIEKPTLAKAGYFLKSKRCLWNSGIFIGRASVFLDEFKRYAPRIYKTAMKIAKPSAQRKRDGLINRYYGRFPDISIDYAVMEKTKRAYVIKSDIIWKDIGSWENFDAYFRKDPKSNLIKGACIGIDSSGSVLRSDKKHLLAALGIKDMIVIHTDDATLIAPRSRSEDVKKLVELIKKKGLKRYL